jgi:hypothetical protein
VLVAHLQENPIRAASWRFLPDDALPDLFSALFCSARFPSFPQLFDSDTIGSVALGTNAARRWDLDR